jgi:hypothetical protein
MTTVFFNQEEGSMDEKIVIKTSDGEVEIDASCEACLGCGFKKGVLVNHPLRWLANVVGVSIDPSDGTKKIIWVKNCLTGEFFSPILPTLMREAE